MNIDYATYVKHVKRAQQFSEAISRIRDEMDMAPAEFVLSILVEAATCEKTFPDIYKALKPLVGRHADRADAKIK